jgi:hypothetical protein
MVWGTVRFSYVLERAKILVSAAFGLVLEEPFLTTGGLCRRPYCLRPVLSGDPAAYMA